MHSPECQKKATATMRASIWCQHIALGHLWDISPFYHFLRLAAVYIPTLLHQSTQSTCISSYISICSDVEHHVRCGLWIVHCALWIMDCARLMIKLSFSPPRWRSQSQTLSPANRKPFPRRNRERLKTKRRLTY